MLFKKNLLLYWLFTPLSAIAQQPLRFHINKLTPDDGLSQGSNYFRHEDQKGFMWLTANNAVNRYDGAFVKVYNLDKYLNE